MSFGGRRPALSLSNGSAVGGRIYKGGMTLTTHLKVGDKFPDVELPNQEGKLKRLSQFTQPSQVDRKLGFSDGYPLIYNRLCVLEKG